MTNIDWHHNLFINNSHRNPLLRSKSVRMVNNLYYNQRFYKIQAGGGISLDVISNIFLAGPMYGDSVGNHHPVQAFAGHGLTAPGTPLVYMLGNKGIFQPNPAGDQWVMTQRVDGENGNTYMGQIPTTWRKGAPLPNTTHPIIAESVKYLRVNHVADSRGIQET